MSTSSVLAERPAAALRGVQTPRISTFPPYVSTAGSEAVDLAAQCGLIVYPWQEHVLRHAMGERPDGKWSAFEVGLVVGRQNGKNVGVLAARQLAGLFVLGERLQIHSAHEFKTAAEHFRRVKELIQSNPELDRRVGKITSSHGDEGIELKTGERLRFVARTTGSGRGFTPDVVYLDEAFRLGPEAMGALLPALSNVPNPQLWYASSAGHDDSVQLWSIRKRVLAGEHTDRLAYFEWSAPDDVDDEDRRGWELSNPTLGWGSIDEEFILSELAATRGAPGEFRRERLGVWDPLPSDVDDHPIPLPAWDACADPGSEIDGLLVFGVDVSMDRRHASIAVAGVRPDGLTHVELVARDEGTDWVVERCLLLAEAHRPAGFALDRSQSSPAASLLDDFRRAGLEPIERSGLDLTRDCGALHDAVVEGVVRHRGELGLRSALAGAQRYVSGDAWRWRRRSASSDISPLVAATVAFGVLRGEQSRVYDPLANFMPNT